jgi:hypothetical protein
MIDWYFAGMFDEVFWAMIGNQQIMGRTAAEVLRPLVAEAGELDLSWMTKVWLLDALCHSAGNPIVSARHTAYANVRTRPATGIVASIGVYLHL